MHKVIIAATFLITKDWEQIKCSSVGVYSNKLHPYNEILMQLY